MKLVNKYNKKRKDSISYVSAITHIFIFLFPLYLSSSIGPGISSILIYLYIGIAFSGLLNLMHETCHNHVFKIKKANQILGNWILGPLFFADFESYKLRHWDHHKFLGKDGETKLTYFIDISGANLLIFIIKGLLLIEMIKKIRNLFKFRKTPAKKKERNLVPYSRILFFQSVFLCLYLLLHLFQQMEI